MTNNKKKNNRNKKRSQNPTNANSTAQFQPGLLQVFPLRLNTKLPYADLFTLSSKTLSSAFGTEQAFRLASLYDPDFTNAGHQPYSFDQIISWYNQYQVKRAKIKLTFSDPSSDGMFVGVFIKGLNDTATLVNATISQATERPNVWIAPLNNTGSQKITYTKEIDLAAFAGLTRAQWDNSFATTGALINANPLYTPYLMIAVADSNSPASASTCKCQVELMFDATFFERITPAQS